MQINVPLKNEDGSVTFNATLNERQLQAVLQFGLGFLLATGLAAQYGVAEKDIMDASPPTQGELFN